MDDPFDSAFLEGPLSIVQQGADLKAAETKLGIDLGEMRVNQMTCGWVGQVPVSCFSAILREISAPPPSNWFSHEPRRCSSDSKSSKLIPWVHSGSW